MVHVDALKEMDWMNTNEAAQWSLNTIISLELIPDSMPEVWQFDRSADGTKG
ncbi:hypothetical protein D3C86_2185920 [compost metagenome]